MPSRDPELREKVDLEVREDRLDGIASGLLTQQTAVLDELGAWVKRHAILSGYARRFPELDRLQKAAQYAGWIIDSARSLETTLSEARVEAIDARDKTQKEINELPQP
jgi:hypothetical protein